MKKLNLPATDLTRWRLHSHEGDHEWRYLRPAESAASPQTFAEQYLFGLTSDAVQTPSKTRQPRSFEQAARDGFGFFSRLQLPEGHWACDYGGPSFLMPGIVFAMYITRTPVPEPWRIELTRYLANHANEDGGWGMHLEGHSTVFATGLYYVMLRLLGMDKEHPLAARARECLLSLGKLTLKKERLVGSSSLLISPRWRHWTPAMG